MGEEGCLGLWVIESYLGSASYIRGDIPFCFSR